MTDRPAGGVSSEQLLDLLSAGAAPSMVLPSWLPPVLVTLYDGCGGGPDVGSDTDALTGWLRRVGAQLQASDGAVPFAVVHDWQARTVVPMMLAAIEPAEPAAAVAALQRLHARAAAGERSADLSEESVWRAVLEPALHALYRRAYDYAGSYATAYASAAAYATANNFSPDGAVSFAESYAAHSAEANRQSFAESNGPAGAAALAAAYARQDGGADAEVAFAEAYPLALVWACAHAVAAVDGAAQQVDDSGQSHQRRQAAYLRLAEGLADSLARRD